MIKSLYIKNFLSIGEIEFDDIGDLDIIGILGGYEGKEGYSNASGKSALAESILFALTGKHRYKTDIEVIRLGETKTEVGLTHINKRNKLVIDRVLVKKSGGRSTSSTIKVTLNNEIVASSTREGQQYINNYFSITPDDFLASYFFRQKEYDTLLRTRSGERIKFLQKFFKSYIFDEAKKKIVQERGKLNLDLNDREGKRRALVEEQKDMTTEAILKSDINSLKRLIILISGKKSTLDKRVKLIESKVKEENNKNTEAFANQEKVQLYNVQIKGVNIEIDRTSIKINHYRREIATINKTVEELNNSINANAKEWTEKEQERLDNLKDNMDKKLVDTQINNSKIELILSAISNLEFNLCPTCGQGVSEEIRKSQLKIKNKEINELKIKNKGISDSLNSSNIKLGLFKSNKKEKIKRWGDKQRENSEVQSLLVKIDGKEDMYNALVDQVSKLKKKIEKLNELKSNIGSTRVDKVLITKLEDEKTKATTKIDILQIDLLDKKSELVKNETLFTRIKSLNTRVATLKREERVIRRKISEIFVLENIFDKCKMEIISIGIEELEEHANNIISEIGAVHKEIAFEKTKENQKGEVSDVLDIYLIDEKGKRKVDGLSGGEWDVSAFALRASLARYKLMRMNSIVDFMVTDEIFGSLDENSREELVNVINMLRDDFSQVIVITHTDLKDAFEHTINVEMGKDGITRLKTNMEG